jgi:NAD(P)-dependent dehydrogenase (short-subunit alcohol dehydrogenase family)
MLAAQAAVELGEQGIRVNAMALGAIDVQGAVRLRRPGAIRVTGTFRWVARRHSRGGRGGGCVPRIR